MTFHETCNRFNQLCPSSLLLTKRRKGKKKKTEVKFNQRIKKWKRKVEESERPKVLLNRVNKISN